MKLDRKLGSSSVLSAEEPLAGMRLWKDLHDQISVDPADFASIDIDDLKEIEIDQLFKNTLGALAGEIQRQASEGRIVQISRNDGSTEVRRTKGVCPRTAEALARSADRWGQFLGMTDRASEVHAAAATLISLAAPSRGADFSSKWDKPSEPAAVDVTTTPETPALPAPEKG